MQSYNPAIPGCTFSDYWKVAKHVNNKNPGKQRALGLMLFYIYLLVLLLQPSVFWLSIATFSNDPKQPSKWIWCTTNPTPARWVTPPWNVYMETF